MPAAIPPFLLSQSPASVRLLNGKTHYSGTVVVRDSGTDSLTVHMSALKLTHCTSPGGAAAWLHIDGPASFTLKSGQSHAVHYTVAAQPGETGSAAIMSAARPVVHHSGNAQLSGSIGTRITLGTSTCHAPVAALPVQHNGGGFPVIDIGAAILCAVAAIAVMQFARRRHNRRHEETA